LPDAIGGTGFVALFPAAVLLKKSEVPFLPVSRNRVQKGDKATNIRLLANRSSPNSIHPSAVVAFTKLVWERFKWLRCLIALDNVEKLAVCLHLITRLDVS